MESQELNQNFILNIKMLEKISKDEWEKVVIQSEESLISQIGDLKETYITLLHIQDLVERYVEKHFEVEYLYDKKKGIVSFEVKGKKRIGFK